MSFNSQTDNASMLNNNTSISRTPNEILDGIFRLANDTEVNQNEDCIVTSSRTITPWPNCEMVISHVCSRWRDVAIAQPRIWTVINPRLDGQHPTPLEMISTYLTRSRNIPISLGLHIPRSATHLDTNNFRSVLKLVVTHVDRWRTLTIRIPRLRTRVAIDPRHVYLPLREIAAPVLEYLVIDYQRCIDDDLPIDNIDEPGILQGGAPLLVSVCLSGVAIQFLRPPLNHTTTLQLVDDGAPCIRWDQVRGMLEAPTCLVRLSVGGDELIDVGAMPLDTIILPTLCELHIRGELNFLMHFLSTARAPTLSSITLENFDDVSDLVGAPSQSFESSGSALRQLSLYNFADTETFYLDAAEAFPHISHLALHDRDIDAALAFLCVDGFLEGEEEYEEYMADPPWPDLRILTLHNFPLAKYYLQELLDVVRTRRILKHPLQKLRLHRSMLKWRDVVDSGLAAIEEEV